MSSELGVGYISIIPEVSKISPGIAKALGAAEPAAESSGKTMGSKISSGISTTLKASVAGAGLAAGGVLAGAITKGMGRLTGIENAEASLRGLGHEAKAVDGIMTNALASVKGTAFGLDTAATVAASAVAAGIKPGQDLERTLKMVGDAATIAKVDMSEMGSIINKVATSDMMQMDVANQLMDAGIPILQMVATEMGVTAGEARKLASEGKVSFETFQNALEKGVGGAALEAGDTFQGAAANMGAALGRLGATGLTPFFDLAKDGMGVATRAIDGLNSAIVPLAQNVGDWLQGTAVPAVKEFGAAFEALGKSVDVRGAWVSAQSTFAQLVDTGRALAPVVVDVASAFGEAGAMLGITTWSLFLDTLQLAGAAVEAAAGPLGSVTGFLKEHPALVAAGIAAWAGFKTVPSIVESLSGSVTKVKTALDPAASNVKIFGSSLREAYGYARAANPEMSALGAGFTVLAGQGGVAATALGGLKTAASNLMGIFGGPWGVAFMAAGAVIGANAQAAARLEAAQDAMSVAARDAATAQHELQAAVAGTSGALNETALAAAATVVKGELSELMEMGEAYSGFIRKVDTDTNVWERMFNIGGQWEEDKAKATAVREEYQALKSAAEELGAPLEDLHAIVADGGTQYDALLSNLRGSGEAGGRAADGLESARAEMDQIVEKARQMDPAVAEISAAIDVLADSSSTADEKLGGLQRMLQAMGLAPKDAELAMRDAATAVEEIVDAATNTAVPLENMGQGLMDAAAAGDWTHQGWNDLSRTLEDMGKELQNVASNGGDVAGTYAMQQQALDALATQYGLTREEIDQLGRSMGLVQDEIAIGVALEGADEATQQLAEVWGRMQEIPPGQTVKFDAITQEAEDALTRIGYSVEEIPGTEEVLIKANTADAQDKLNNVFAQMGQMDGLTVSPTVLLDTSPLVSSAANAEAILAALALENPTLEAQLIIDKLLEGVNISQGELDFLASQTPTPIADLEKKLLESGVSVSHEMLTALQNHKTTPTLDADGRPLNAAVDAAQGKLGQLKDKQVTITTVHHRIDYWTQQGHSPEQAARIQGPVPLPGRYLGGRIPGLADGGHAGYRLPLSGPGTDVVDGFLGLDDNLMPVARVNTGEWVVNGDSSAKYDRAISLINADHPSVRHLQRLEGGGKVGAADLLAFARGETVNGQRASRSLEGAPYVFGGINWGDCSGAMSALARFAVGLSAFGARFATGNQREALAALGFLPGLGGRGDFNLGWLNGGPGGGHTSGTIGGTNVEMGGGRGNGQIGGNAAPASHPQYTDHAHLPLGQGMRGETITIYGADGSIGSGASHTSVDGISLKSGTTVDFGEASDFYKQALGYLNRPKVGLFDTGGILRTGQFAYNAGPPERVLSPTQTLSFDRALTVLPASAADLRVAAAVMLDAAELDIESARMQVQSTGRNLGGDWVGQAQIVQDAEQGLIDLRKALVVETENIVKAEENLAEAQERLTEAQSEGAVLSDSATRKIEDAEEALAKAREGGKADKIADAEKRLSRAREDAAKELEKSEEKNAKDVKKAMEDVGKAEETLAEARATNEDAAMRLEAAERAIAAARYQALADMVTGVGEALGKGVMRLGGFFDEMERLAGIVEQTRQSVSKLQMQQITNQVNLLRAQHALQVSEWDLHRVRARGAINLVEAEMQVEEARAKAALMGSTSVEAMAGAMDRFRVTGIFSVEEVSESVIENSREVQAALWGVKVVEAQNALDALNASHQQALAQFAVAEATLTQHAAVEMLRLQTSHLHQQTAELYGLTQNQAKGASKGFGGIGQALGGAGQVIGGILTGLAGFAVGGPLGAIPGALMAVKGLGDVAKGGIDAWTNKDDIKDAWGKMGTGEKVAIVGGGLLGAGAAVGGAYLGGPEGAVAGAELGAAILDTTIGSLQHSIASRMDKQQRDYADRMAALQLSIDRQQASLGEDKLIAELDFLRDRDRLEADVEYSKLMQQAASAANDQLADRLLEAAAVEAARAGRASDDQLSELRRSGDALDTLVELMRKDKTAAAAQPAATDQQLAGLVSAMSKMLNVGGNAYVNARL